MIRRVVQRFAAPVALTLLAGCSVSALDLGAPEPDRSVITGSIVSLPEDVSGEIRPPVSLPDGTDAMLHAMVGAMGDGLDEALPLSWSAPEKGARGVISHIYDDETGTCRRFVTSRESFDGISLYRGTICASPEFGWQIEVFEPV